MQKNEISSGVECSCKPTAVLLPDKSLPYDTSRVLQQDLSLFKFVVRIILSVKMLALKVEHSA